MSSHSIRVAYLGRQRPQAGGPIGAQASVWSSTRQWLLAMVQARRTRRLLTRMDDHMLADIGLGRGDAMVEAARPMWDIDRSRR